MVTQLGIHGVHFFLEICEVSRLLPLNNIRLLLNFVDLTVKHLNQVLSVIVNFFLQKFLVFVTSSPELTDFFTITLNDSFRLIDVLAIDFYRLAMVGNLCSLLIQLSQVVLVGR